MGLRVCLIPGDGIGPEVTAAARRTIDASGAAVEWEVHELGRPAYDQGGEAMPEPTLEAIRESGLALKGPIGTRADDPFPSVNVGLRRRLGLFLGVRPARSFPGAPGHFPGTDLAVLRMHEGDLYAGFDYAADDPTTVAIRDAVSRRGGQAIPADAGLSLKPISRRAAERAARAACEWAIENGRERLTVVHKANVMRASDGTFLAAAREVAVDFPGLAVDDLLVDRAAAELVRAPGEFDVLFAPMLYGDILSDLTAALCGGLGLAPGASLGDGCGVFEAVHGSAPRHAGKETANPSALILSGALMLRHGGEPEAAARVERAVAAAIRDGAVTRDLAAPGREPLTTTVMTDAIVERL